MQEVTTVNNEKIFFKYLVSDKNFKYDSYIFSHPDIKRTYEYLKMYHYEYSNLPQPIVVSESLDIKIGIVNQLLNFDELHNYDRLWIKTNFETYLKKSVVNNEASKILDDIRSGNIDKVYDRLKLTIDDDSIDDKPFDYVNSTPEQIKQFTTMLSKADPKDVSHHLVENFDPDKEYEVNNYLLYPVFKEKQLGIIFGVTGEGKSILAVEFANMIANGKSNWETFRVDTPPQNVLYIDFELGGSSFQSRYRKSKYSKNFKLVHVNNFSYNINLGFDSKQGQKLDKALNFIIDQSQRNNAKVIFIDNLSNIADQVEKASEANRFISDLYARMKHHGLSIMLIGHTPKIANDVPININQLKGSSSLTQTFESVIGFKRSKDKNLSYIKQVKHRNIDPLFSDEEESVGVFEFDSHGKDGWTMNYIGIDDENNLLPDKIKTDRKSKYDNNFIINVLYDLNILGVLTGDVTAKYNITDSTIYNFRKYLKDNRNNILNEYNLFCKNNKGNVFRD